MHRGGVEGIEMNLANLASGWLAALKPRRAPPAAPEAADLGTAFGLDMSLTPMSDTEFDRCSAEPVDPTPTSWLRVFKRT